MSKETGGPAFPTTKESHLMICSEGMTLRDYFAAKAMQSLCSFELTNRRSSDPAVTIAENAYKVADAMIAQRKKDEN